MNIKAYRTGILAAAVILAGSFLTTAAVGGQDPLPS